MKKLLPALLALLALSVQSALAEMAAFPEDAKYKGGAASTASPFTPQEAREAFGPPPDWMHWANTHGGAGDGGAYVGIQSMDDEKPFVFHGGGQSGPVKYVGPYVMICDQPVAKGLTPQDIVSPSDDAPQMLEKFEDFPFHVVLRQSGKEDQLCVAAPTNWYAQIEIASKFRSEYDKSISEWQELCAKDGRKMLVEEASPWPKRCFRINRKSSSDASVLTLETVLIGDSGDIYDPEEYETEVRRYKMPDEVKAHYKSVSDITEDDIDYMVEQWGGRDWLILRDGGWMQLVKNGK